MALEEEQKPDTSSLGTLHEESEGTGKTLGHSAISITDLSSPTTYSGKFTETSLDSGGFLTRRSASHHHHNSLINFNGGYGNFMQSGGESLLCFDANDTYLRPNKDEHLAWDGNLNQNYQWNRYGQRLSGLDPRVIESFNCLQTASSFSAEKESQHGDRSCGWVYSEATVITDSSQDYGTHETALHKRLHMEESTQASKKQCNTSTKKPKTKSSPSKDPQSIAAKNRRERISERLKILQELVPNGSKVDLVTMLEKAISYVKFLQLQVKFLYQVLATDEFWPVQGGKAPDISQVKEAIDAILSSHRDRNSSSSK